MNHRKKLLTAMLIILIAGLMATPGAARDLRQELTQQSALEQIMKRGTLRVGMDTFKPWAMKDKTGELIGFEIDVATRLAEDMGVKVEFIPTKWAGIIPALLTNKFDIIIGGMGIRPQRNLKVNFTIPYDNSGMSIVANKKYAAWYKKVADFNRKEVTVAARIGTTAAQTAKKFFPKAKLKLFGDEAQAIQEVLNDRAQAMVASAPLPAYTAIKYPDQLYLPVVGTFTKEPIGFAIRKGDVDTLNFMNSWITVVAAEGWLKERKHYWFETKDWEKYIQ